MFDVYLLRKLNRLERSRDTAGLIKMLRHRRSRVVSRAATALGRTKHPAAVTALVTLLRARDTADVAAKALGQIGDAASVTALAETLIDSRFAGDPDRLLSALETGIRVLRGGEDDDELYESISARVEAEIADAERPQAKSPVGAVPADQRGVSLAAVERIRGLAMAGAYAAAIDALQDLAKGSLSVRDHTGQPWIVRHYARAGADLAAAELQALEFRAQRADSSYSAKFEEDALKGELATLANHLRTLPTRAVADPPPPSPQAPETDALVVDLMWRLLRDGDEKCRRAAVDTLRMVGGPEAVTALREGLADGSHQVRRAALLALHRLGALDSVEDLRGALTDEWWPIRLATVAPLGEIADPAAVEALRGLMTDKSPDVRRAAVAVLSKVDRRAGGH